MQIGVLGAGSLGSLVGGLLGASGTDVVLYGRESDHLAAVRDDGVVVERPDGRTVTGDVAATSDAADLADVDALLVCVKSYDTDAALADVADALPDGADVATLQNGLGNAETIAAHVPEERVVAGTTTHGATLAGPGRVRHAGGGDTRVGRYFAANDERVSRLAARLTDAGIETAVTESVRDAVWEKVLVNAGINAATALARVPNGALAAGPGERVLRRAVEEGELVAAAEGHSLESDPVEAALAVAERTAENVSSMRQDLEAGRRTEIEALNGELVRRADDHGLGVPVNRTLTDLVRLATDA